MTQSSFHGPCSLISPCALSISRNTALCSPGREDPAVREAGGARPEDAAAPGVKRGVRAGDEATGRASHEGRERGGAGRRKGTAGGRAGGRAGSSRAPAERGPASRGRSEGRRRVPPAPQPALHPAPPFCASPCVSGQRRSLRSCQLPPVRRAAPSMASFPPTVNEKLIARPRTVGELLAPTAPFDKKCGRENWTVAFAPDGSYFAWSQGHRIVKLVPWAQCLSNFLLHGTKNVANSVSTRLPRQNSDGGQKNKPCEHIIDCGDIVWSLAFGSSVPEKQSRCVNIEWHRFKFGQDQLLLATGLNNGRIKIWDAYTGKLLLNLMDHTEVVRDLTFAPDGSLILVSASRDKTLRVWDLKDDGNMMKVLRGHQNWVYGCAFSPDSSVLCSVGASKAVFLWDMDKYSMIRKLEGHHNDVVACEFSPDGALLATASYDTRVYVWDPHIGVILMEFGHLFPPPTPIFAGGANDRWVRSVSFSHDGLHIASLADDKMVRFWRIDEEYPVQVAPLNNGLCCTFSTDGSVLAAGTQDGSVFFWATPRQVSSLQHLCRMAIRRVMPTGQVKNLPIPSKVAEFLCYRM